MAYSNTVVDYYSNLIANSYASTISGQISRIEDATKVLRNKAIELGLKIPAGQKLTNNSAGTTELALASTHHILDTAAAINNIPINRDTAKTISAGGSYTVPVGYNATAYTITASGLSDQTGGTANAADILKDKTAWVNGVQVTGSMKDKSGNQKASNSSYYTDANNNRYLYLEIPETGKYSGGSQLRSEIAYRDASNVEIPVTIITTNNNETVIDTSKASFPAGYYNGTINVSAILKDSTNKVLNVSNSVPTIEKQSGSLVIPGGFDYFAPNASYSVKGGSIAAVTYTPNTSTGAITFGGGAVTAGWISSNVSLPATYTPPEAQFTTNTLGKVTVSTAGWVTAGSEIGGVGNGSATMTGPTQNTGGSSITVGSTSIANNNYYMKLVTTAGYISASTVGIDLKRTTLATGSLSSAASGATTITSQYWKVTASTGYNHQDLVQNLTVRSAQGSKIATSGVYQVTTAGWIAAGNYGGLSAGSVTLSQVQTHGSTSSAVNGVTIAANSHYVKVDVSAGYITTASSTALDLGKMTLSNGTSNGTATTTITTQTWQVTASKGYNPGSQTTIFKVKDGSVGTSVTIGSDYACSIAVTEGWVKGGTLPVSIKAEDQTYALTTTDLGESDHEFTVAAASGSLMKSLKINTKVIYDRLVAI